MKNQMSVTEFAKMGGEARWRGKTKEERKAAMAKAHEARRSPRYVITISTPTPDKNEWRFIVANAADATDFAVGGGDTCFRAIRAALTGIKELNAARKTTH
jgi:hypothetical protein